MSSGWLSEQHQAIYYSVLSSSSLVYAGLFKENVRYPVWICRVPIFFDFRDPMIIFSDSRDPNRVPKSP